MNPIAGYLLNFVYAIGLVIASPWLLYRSIRTHRYRAGLGEKLLGRVPKSDLPTIWLHAVSVGEVQLLRTVVAGLQKEYPDAKFCISTTTESGMALADSLFPALTRFYLPLDFTWAVRSAMVRLKPRLLILVELEVWPNLIAQAKRYGCSVGIVNGRLSEGSFRGYRRFKLLFRSTFASLDFVAAQDLTYAERFVAMGTPEKNVADVGNIKFDGAVLDRNHPEIESRRKQLGLSPDHLVWVVGSTQSPEEKYAIDAFANLKNRFPTLRLIVVPRHPDRFEEVAKWLDESGLEYRRRSLAREIAEDHWEVLLGDTVGELRWWWGLADIAFVGGSFGERGGQNMIEPAAFGVSTAVGPNTKNFRDTMRLLRDKNAVTELESPQAMLVWAEKNLESQELRQTIGSRSNQVVTEQRGAIERTLQVVSRYLKDK